MDNRTRWLALIVLCLGDLMIVLDTTIVNVALPSIQEDLGFSEASLAWVVNAYLLTFGGFMLLGGRLGDLFGHRRLFLIGIALFTAASLACGLAESQEMLVAARAVQGLGGAVVAAVALSLIMTLFTEPGERAKAMGVIGFVAAGGGSDRRDPRRRPDRRARLALDLPRQPPGRDRRGRALARAAAGRRAGQRAERRLDVAGAVTVTAALMLAVYAIVNGNEAGWTSGADARPARRRRRAVGGLPRDRGSRAPRRSCRSASSGSATSRPRTSVGVLWSAAMFAWFFLSALYLQLVLGYSPLEVGLAFLPANLIMAAFSLGLSAKLVMRFGLRAPLASGCSLSRVGLLLFARAPVDGSFVVDVLPAWSCSASASGWR